ncbi:hypothetical protein ACQ4PT_016792 [Festuca glaucescens]
MGRAARSKKLSLYMVMERLRSMSTIFFNYNADEYDSITPPASQLHHLQGCYDAPQEEGGDEMRQAASEVEPEPAVLPAVESVTATMTQPTPSAPGAAAAAASTSGNGKEEPETWEEMSTPAAAAAKGASTLERPRKWKVAGIAERRAFAEIEEKAEVNARAERFIRQFREDLKLERLNSILTSRKC